MSQEEALQLANKELEKVGRNLREIRYKYRCYGPYVPDVTERINLLTNQRRRLQRRIKKILTTVQTTPQPKNDQQVLFSLEPTTAESPSQKLRRQSSTERSRLCPHCFARNYGKHRGDVCDNCGEEI